MDEYEERTLSVIAPEQEVRFVLLPAGHILCLFLPSFEIQNSSDSERMCQPSSDPVLKCVGSQLGNLSSEELGIVLASFWGEGGVVSFVATPE